jgi:chorismate synthase
MLRYLTAGESHGKLLIGILEGIPAGLSLTSDDINRDLARRQRGYGRGGRMKIEHDTVEIVSGVRKGKTMGSPIGLLIQNRDWENWQERMAVEPGEINEKQKVTKPRPGHADLSGVIKYGHDDVRNSLERASARDTATRVAVGAVAKRLLEEFEMSVFSHVVEIGDVVTSTGTMHPAPTPEKLHKLAEESEVRCADLEASKKMIQKIDEAKAKGDSLGGIFEVIVTNPPIGLGSYVQWDRRLTARLAMALMSIQAMKGVEVGLGFESARRFGSEVHDEIFYDKKARRNFYRKTNRAGGIEGGMTNGEDIVLRTAMKPIATLYKPLQSVDLKTKEPFKATIERSDICTVPAASVIGEAVVAFETASAMVEKFGGDSLQEMKHNFKGYMDYVRQR